MSDFSKSMLEQFADSPALKTLQNDISIFNETVKEATEKNFDKNYTNDLKNSMISATIANYEKNRAEELEKLNNEITKLEEGYQKKMIFSDEAIKRQNIIDKQYSALSDGEIEARYKDYLNMKINDAAELETLSRQLRERKNKSFESFRKTVVNRGDDKPVRKLNPSLYEHYNNLKNLEHGQALIYMQGEGMDGKKKQIPQAHSIRDLLKN